MKKTSLISFMLFIFSLSALPGRAEMFIAVSIEPQRYFAEKLGGEHVDVMALVGMGEDPHTYEPGPRQMERLSSARVYFIVGVEFERAWLPRFRLLNPSMAVISTGPELERPGESTAHAHEHGDPHIWTAPRKALEMAESMRDGLIEIDPANAAAYKKNFQSLAREIEALDAYIKGIFSSVSEERRAFMVYHPAWGHFAEAYGLEQIAVEHEGREPSPAELARTIEKAGRNNISVVFVQPRGSRRAAETVAGEIGARVEAIDPLAYDWAQNLREAADRIRGSMTKEGGR